MFLSLKNVDGKSEISPRFSPDTKHQYQAALYNSYIHKTNKVSVRRYNHYQFIIKKHHSDLFSTLKEFQLEQTDVEIMVIELK